MGTQLLKASWKTGAGEDEQYMYVDDCENDEKDWLSEVPVPHPVLISDAGTTELRLASLRRILESDDELHAMTGYNRERFGRLYREFARLWQIMEEEEMERKRQYWKKRAGKRGRRPAADIREDQTRNIPLIQGDLLRESDPGNRCKLHPAYILLLDLMRKYRNDCEVQLAIMFGISQAAVSRYIGLADRVLAETLPTPRRFMQIMRGIDTPEKFAAMFPKNMKSGAILIDGTHVRFTRSSDKEVRDAMYSGKKKAYTGNTVLFTTPDKLVIAISDTYEGSMHDITITKEFLKDLGAFATGVLGAAPSEAGADKPVKSRPSTASSMTIRVLGDAGFQGLEKDLPGAVVETPYKKPPGGQLTKRQKAHNKELSSERVAVENAIASVKHYRRVSSTYEGDLDGFNDEFNVAAGLANARLMFRNGTYDHWQAVLDRGKPGGI